MKFQSCCKILGIFKVYKIEDIKRGRHAKKETFRPPPPMSQNIIIKIHFVCKCHTATDPPLKIGCHL